MLVAQVANFATSHVLRALGASETAVGVEHSAGGAAVAVADFVNIKGVAYAL